jgi:NAD(P)-dependent dehydrogenase (short-subunit alcohol dehydrogenase family)
MTTSTASGSRLTGKVAIVTGGGSGFGEAISKRFSDEGCKVIVADVNPEGGARVSQYNKDNMHFVQMNVAKSDDWENCLKECIDKWGKVDVVVNNAGTSYPNKVCWVLRRNRRGYCNIQPPRIGLTNVSQQLKSQKTNSIRSLP